MQAIAEKVSSLKARSFAESVAIEYQKPLSAHIQRSVKSPLVQERIKLLYGVVPVVKQIKELVSTLLTEILCSNSLSALEAELQASLGLSPEDLHAPLEFLTVLLSPNSPS
jgi:hypothetical protein